MESRFEQNKSWECVFEFRRFKIMLSETVDWITLCLLVPLVSDYSPDEYDHFKQVKHNLCWHCAFNTCIRQ
jgi:hypothetical protein